MSGKFLTDLVVRQLMWDNSEDTRGTWRTYAPLRYYSAITDQAYEVPADFLTDFASVPRVPVFFLMLGNSCHAAAVIHDWLYSTHQVTRDVADKIFKEACIACGSYGWKAELMYRGVRLGGEGPWESAGQRQTPSVATEITAAALEAP